MWDEEWVTGGKKAARGQVVLGTTSGTIGIVFFSFDQTILVSGSTSEEVGHGLDQLRFTDR